MQRPRDLHSDIIHYSPAMFGMNTLSLPVILAVKLILSFAVSDISHFRIMEEHETHFDVHPYAWTSEQYLAPLL